MGDYDRSPPVEPGTYWHRYEGKPWMPLRVHLSPRGRLWVVENGTPSPDEIKGEWGGRCLMPGEVAAETQATEST